jgi:parallel beta-helix repeat protein
MHLSARYAVRIAWIAGLAGAMSLAAGAATLCVDPSGHHGCYKSIQAAVTAAASGDVVRVAPGTYKEDVTIGKPLSLLGAGWDDSVIDATGLADGIFIDGLDYPGLTGVTVAGFKVKKALYEGVLVVSTSNAVIRDNKIVNNDQTPAVFGSGPACTGQPAFETDESGDCGGGLHLIGVVHSVISGNILTGNGDGILISDETGMSRDNLIIHNQATDNPPECGIVLASHPPVGSAPPAFAKHFGVVRNTVADNLSARNGVSVGGGGVGLFSDGQGQGRVSGNVIVGNQLIDNGIPGVSLHTHVGPAFGLPADDMDGNQIIDNFISGNGADTDDTATPASAGININSGGGGSPVLGTIIAGNTIVNEEIGIAANTPAEVDAHLNTIDGASTGAANVCSLDNPTNPTVCTGSMDVTENFWGCAAGPGKGGCTTMSGANILFTPWLRAPIEDQNGGH